jgi:1,2-diacylglycerol 3-beta-glucosyltransferase
VPDISGSDLLNTTAFVLCVTFCAYVVGILVLYVRAQPATPGDPERFSWHVIIPCLNEAAVIEATVRDLFHRFPEVVVWCVDDGSDDDTGAILAGLSGHPRLRVITRVAPLARQGKGAALNAGWRALIDEVGAHTDTSSIVVGVVDADGRLAPHALRALAGRPYFGKPTVSAVQIEVRMHNRGRRRRRVGTRWGRLLVTLQDLEFRGPIAAMQELRRQTGSVGLGGNGQFTRLSILNDIAGRHGTPWHGALLEDFELGLHILLAGGRTEYCRETWVSQEGLTRARHLIRQRTRWAQGCMQCMRYAPAILRSRHIPNSAALEIGYFLLAPWIQLIGSLVYVICLGVMGFYALTSPGGPAGWWSAGGWGVAPLMLVFGIAPFAVWGLVYRARCDPRLSRLAAVGLGVGHWAHSYVQCVAAWLAFFRLVRARSDWQKTARLSDTKTTDTKTTDTKTTGTRTTEPQKVRLARG